MRSNMRKDKGNPVQRAGLNKCGMQSLPCIAEVLPVEYLVEFLGVSLGLSRYLDDYA